MSLRSVAISANILSELSDANASGVFCIYAERYRRQLCELERERRRLIWVIDATTRGMACTEREAIKRVVHAQRAVAFALHATPGFHDELARLLYEGPHTIDELVVVLYGDDMRPARVSLMILLSYMRRAQLARQLPDGRWCAVPELMKK